MRRIAERSRQYNRLPYRRNRDGSSTRKLDIGVFTQPGPIAEIVPAGEQSMSASQNNSVPRETLCHKNQVVVGDDFRVRRIDLYGMEAYSPDYLQLNPNHSVPLIRFRLDDGAPVTAVESGAILTLLADAFPERGFAPRPAPLSAERADYLQTLYFGAAAVDMMLWQIRIHEHVLPDAQKDHRTIERYRRKFMTEVEPQLAARLKRDGFICGPCFSAADCMIGHGVLWAKAYGLCADEAFDRYIGRLAAHESFAKAFADRGEMVLQVPPDALVLDVFTG
jgi:glutathione S-transferase